MKNRLTWMMTLVCLLLTLTACGEKEEIKKEEVRPIRAMTIADREAFGGRWFPGKAKATQEANLSFRVPGTVSLLPVNIGTQVPEGTLLARLDPQDYKVELDNARAQLSAAKAGLELAESEFARVDRVFKTDPGAVSKSMVDVRKAELDTAHARLSSATSAVEAASDNLRYTSLSAPFNGVVVERFVEQHEDVQAKQEIIRFLDNSSLEFIVQVPETLMVNVDEVRKLGAYVVFDTYPEVNIPAQVKEVGKEASKTTRTYPVTLSMDQPEDFTIFPGMAGKARAAQGAVKKIAEDTGMIGFEVPISATFSDTAEQSFVWVVDTSSMQVKKTPVKILSLTQQGAMVSGIEVGDVLATAGVNQLVEGQTVRILE